MFQKFVASLVLLIWCVTPLTVFADGEPIDFSARVSIRGEMDRCRIVLSPPAEGSRTPKNDSDGVLLWAKDDGQTFHDRLTDALAQGGRESFVGGDLYVTGIKMGEEAKAQRETEAALLAHQLSTSDVRVHVLSLPQGSITALVRQAATLMVQKLTYWFPNITRHYQKPQLNEVINGILSTIPVEVPNVILLYHALPTLDANLTVATHATTLALYAVYTKFMLNWLLDPGTKGLPSFLKQASLSVPFIINYNGFGKFSQYMAVYREHGWEGLRARFGSEAHNIVFTQGFTILLQTYFYKIVITDGIGKWVASQTGENEAVARALRGWIQTPILALDALALYGASSNWLPLLHLGSFDLNMGHVSLATLMGTGYLTVTRNPRILDPTLTLYHAWMGSRMREFFAQAKKPSDP